MTTRGSACGPTSFRGGTILHLDTKGQWTLSALGSYEIHSHKKDSDIKVGDIFTVEGGLGKTFIKAEEVGGKPVPSLITTVGLAYYGQFKVTADKVGAASNLLAGDKDRVFAVGVEANVIVPKTSMIYGLRIEPEFGARNRTQGWTFLLTIGYELKSLVKAP